MALLDYLGSGLNRSPYGGPLPITPPVSTQAEKDKQALYEFGRGGALPQDPAARAAFEESLQRAIEADKLGAERSRQATEEFNKQAAATAAERAALEERLGLHSRRSAVMPPTSGPVAPPEPPPVVAEPPAEPAAPTMRAYKDPVTGKVTFTNIERKGQENIYNQAVQDVRRGSSERSAEYLKGLPGITPENAPTVRMAQYMRDLPADAPTGTISIPAVTTGDLGAANLHPLHMAGLKRELESRQAKADLEMLRMTPEQRSLLANPQAWPLIASAQLGMTMPREDAPQRLAKAEAELRAGLSQDPKAMTAIPGGFNGEMFKMMVRRKAAQDYSNEFENELMRRSGWTLGPRQQIDPLTQQPITMTGR